VIPTRDVALCIELRERPIRALMTREDWGAEIDRYLTDTDDAPVGPAGSATPTGDDT